MGFWDGAVNAAGGVVSQGLSMIGQKKRNERAYGQQRNLMNLQKVNQRELNKQGQELAMKTWRETNYPAQMKMLEQAGLNPALMYGMSGGGGTTAQSGSGGSASGGSAPSQPTMDMGNLLMGAQMELMKAQAKKANAEAGSISGEEGTVGGSIVQLNTQNANTSASQEALNKANTYLQDLQGEITGKSLDNIIDQYQWNSKRAMYEADSAASQSYVDRETREARIGTIEAQEATSILAAGLMKAQTAKTWEEGRKLANDILVANGLLKVAEQNASTNRRNATTNEDSVYYQGMGMNRQETQNKLRNALQERGIRNQELNTIINAITGIGRAAMSGNHFNYDGPGPQR